MLSVSETPITGTRASESLLQLDRCSPAARSGCLEERIGVCGAQRLRPRGGEDAALTASRTVSAAATVTPRSGPTIAGRT